MSAPALRLSGVRKRFGERVALDGLDLEVPAGSVFGLIGPNGAGKTTTFSIACGFLRADAGSVELLGAPGFDARRLKGRMTAMPQDAALGGTLRCREHLEHFARLQGIEAVAARRSAADALAAVGLSDRAEVPARTLSHGMMRRLSVAQALLGSPELVILDEPTSGLDPKQAHELRGLLAERRGQRTLVISSHNLAELESLCDHVAFVDRGRRVGGGPIDEVTGRGAEVEIELGAGAAPVDAVRAALPGHEVRWDTATRRLTIRRPPRGAATPGAPGEVEDTISAALRALLDGGARIGAVSRGRSLERRYLELG